MPNKKTRKKRAKLRKPVAKKGRPVKSTPRKKLAKKKLSPKRKKTKKAEAKTKALGKKKAGAKKTSVRGKRNPAGSQNLGREAFSPPGRRARTAGQSGDLQGLSNVERAGSESVDELLEEGNAFEADVVSGVESAGNEDEKEVRTHEVPEDDVPGEYLDKE